MFTFTSHRPSEQLKILKVFEAYKWRVKNINDFWKIPVRNFHYVFKNGDLLLLNQLGVQSNPTEQLVD